MRTGRGGLTPRRARPHTGDAPGEKSIAVINDLALDEEVPPAGEPEGDAIVVVEDDDTVGGPAPVVEAEAGVAPRSALSLRLLAVELAVLSAVTLAVSWVTLELWRIPFGLSLTYTGDELAGLTHVKGVDETGWWFTNPRLGAPFQLEHYDFPHGGESLQVLMVRTLAIFSDAPAAILNAYLIITFVLVAASAYVVLRYLRFEPMIAGVVGVLYSFLPFHFWHLVGHIYRSGYFAAPVAALALLWLAGYDGGVVVSHGPGFRQFSLRRGRVGVVVLAVVLVATTDVVAAAFAPAIAGSIGLLAVLRQRAWRTLAIVTAFSAAVIALVVAVNIPTLRYQDERGPNNETVQRQLLEQELYALKLSRVILPSPMHPIAVFAEQGRKPRTSPIRSEGGQALGLLGVAGLISGVVAAVPLGSAVERRKRERLPGDRQELRSTSGLLMIVIILLAVPSGLAYLSSVLGFEEIRTWNRIVVYLGFYALVCVAVGLEGLSRWLRSRGARGWMVAGVLVAIGIAGLYDETPGGRNAYEARIAQWNQDAHFFAQLEDRLTAPEPMVFQLPVVPYPEPDGDNLIVYDHFRGYLHTDEVAWSHGAMRGRPESVWQTQLIKLPTEVALDSLAAIGFDGVYVDTFGYADRGASLLATVADPVLLRDERQLFIPLGDRAAALDGALTAEEVDQLVREVLFPVEARPGPGFQVGTSPTGGRFATEDTTFELVPADGAARTVTLRMTVLTAPGGGHSVTLLGPDGELAQGVTPVPGRTISFELVLDVPAEGMELRLLSDSPQYSAAGDPRDVHVEVAELVTTGPAVAARTAAYGDATVVTLG